MIEGLRIGESIEGSVIGKEYLQKVRFGAPKGMTVKLKATRLTNDLRLVVSVMTQSGQVVLESKVLSSKHPATKFTLPERGTYVFRIKRKSGEGDYTLQTMRK